MAGKLQRTPSLLCYEGGKDREEKKRKGKLPDLCVLNLTPCGVSKPSILS